MTIAAPIANSLQRASWIRQMFEAGARLKQQYGADQVFDFSLGNPILEPPAKVHETLHALLDDPAPGHHRYMPNGGFPAVREYLANELREEQGLSFEKEDVVLCVGAGGGLNVVAKALLEPGDEVVALAPYFVEYGFYVQNHAGVLTVAKTRQEDFLPDLEALEAVMTPKTRAIIVNSPNNPTGVVYPRSTQRTRQLAEYPGRRFGRPIYLIADEPYRKLLFDEVTMARCSRPTPLDPDRLPPRTWPGRRADWLHRSASESSRSCSLAGGAGLHQSNLGLRQCPGADATGAASSACSRSMCFSGSCAIRSVA